MSVDAQLRSLHHVYCESTGLDLKYGYHTERLWYDFWKEGFTAEDLRLVIGYLKTLYREKPEIRTASLRLHMLVGDLLRFSEYSAEARAVQRAKKAYSDKESVLRATHRPTEQPKDARRLGDVLKSEAFRDFINLKEQL